MKTPVLLALGLLLASLATVPAQIYPDKSSQISLSGSAEVKVAPDEILLNVGVETRSETLEPARQQNDQKIAAILDFLKQSGIKPGDIQMDYVSVEPYYYGDSLASHIKPAAYIVHKNLEIRLKDVARFSDILTGTLTNGANYVNNIDFRTTQLRKYRDQARAMAVKAAREKAGAITSELGVKLGKVTGITLNDYNNYYYGGYYNRQFNGGFNNAAQNVATVNEMPADAGDDSFAAGQISISATVNVSFAIE